MGLIDAKPAVQHLLHTTAREGLAQQPVGEP